MTSRERMLTALEGKAVDAIPVAPYFWGAEYAWKLLGRPIWEVLHGAGDVGTELLGALDHRHACDWVIPLHQSSGQLVGKTYSWEDEAHVYFTDDTTGEKFVFHKEGHWLVSASEMGRARASHLAADVEPPRNWVEADDWLKRWHRHLESEPTPHEPNRALREQFPDRFLCAPMMAPFAGFAYAIGFEPALVLLHENPRLCACMIERTMAHLPFECRDLAADGFDGGMMCDSWASADIMSPETYANWIAPLHKMVSDELHSVGLRSIVYNTGNALPLLDTIAGEGYDAISVEERVKGVEMDIGGLRRRLGPEACLVRQFRCLSAAARRPPGDPGGSATADTRRRSQVICGEHRQPGLRRHRAGSDRLLDRGGARGTVARRAVLLVGRGGIEPPTLGLRVPCSA